MISVVESYLAMTRELPYRAALSKQEAMDVLQENWEMRYDPEIVAAFIEILKDEPDSVEPSIGELLTSL
jgi:HD-GYP domain-containing protein (c-di-GMP phosphodiesterase class II)